MQRSWLGRALTLALVTALAIGGCGGGSSDDRDEQNTASSTSTSGLLAADGSPITGSTDPGGRGSADGPATSAGGVAPERNDIPLPGRYTYAYSTGSDSSERILDVHDTGERRGNVRQQTYFGSGSTVTAQLVVWFGTDLYYVEAEQRASGSKSGSLCAWKPGFVELDLPLAVGKSWSSDSTCTSENGSRRRTMQAKVTGTEDIEVGGVRVKVWVIERTVDTHTEAKGSNITVISDEKRVSTDRFSVDRHLLARSDATESTTLNGVPKGSTSSQLALNALNPSKIPGQ